MVRDLYGLRRDPEGFSWELSAHYSLQIAGRHLVYSSSVMRGANAAPPRLFVRELASGRERSIDMPEGTGFIVDAHLGSEGEWVFIDVHGGDSNGNLQRDLPARRYDDYALRCLGRPRSWGPSLVTGDRSQRWAARVAGGPARRIPGLLAPFGSALLIRASDGALLLDRGDGAPAMISPPACAAKVLGLDVQREQVVVACAVDGSNARSLELHTPNSRHSLDLELNPMRADDFDPLWPSVGRLFVLRDPNLVPTPHFIDLERRALLDIDLGRPQLLGPSDGDSVLLVRPARWTALDLKSGVEQELTALVDERWAWYETRDSFVVFDTHVIFGLAERRVLGRTRGWPLALSGHRARALVSRRRHRAGVIDGPLVWETLR